MPKLTPKDLAKLDATLAKQVHILAINRGYGVGIYKVIGASLQKVNALAKSDKSVRIEVSTFDAKDFTARKVGKKWTAKKKKSS